MNILFYPSWYQTTQKHNNGIFFRDQAEAIQTNCNHTVVFFITNIQWQKRKFGFPRLKVEERNENGLIVWEYSASLPTVFKLVRVQERVTLEMLRIAIIRMKHKYGKIDLIHAQSFLKAGYDACRLRKRYKIPVITTEHLSSVAGGLAPHAKQKFLYTIEESDKIISVSTFLDSKIERFLPDQDKRTVIHNLVSRQFTYDPQAEKNDEFTFLSVGHLIPGKRIDVLIEGFVKAFDEKEKVQLLIVGDGPQRSELERRVQEECRTHQVKFLGALSHSEVFAQMKKAHVLVHTSQLETFGVVLIEALSVGLPIICTRCGGPEDILTNYGCTSIAVNHTDELIEAMRQVRLGYEKYDLARISREAKDRFGDQVIATQINKIYESVVNGFGDDGNE